MKNSFALLSLCGLVATASLQAQNPPQNPRDLPNVPGLVPVNQGQEKIYENGFQNANMTGQEVADLYRDLTDQRVRVLVSREAADAEFRFVQPGPMTATEAIDVLEKLLLMEGFVLVESGPNQVKLVLNGSAEVPVVEGARNLPPGDLLITYDMQLDHLSPEDAARTFQQVIGSEQGTSVVPVPNAQSIIITAKSPVIRKLRDLKERIDVPPSDISKRYVPVRYADVEEIAEILNQIFGQSSGGGGGARRASGGNGVPNPAAAAAAAAAGSNVRRNEDNPPQIVPLPRTNRIFLLGRPIDLLFIEELIADIDQPTDSRNIRRKKLKFLKVTEFLDTIEVALEEPSSVAGQGGAGAAGNNRPRSNTGGNSRSNTRGGTRGGSGGSNGGFGGGGGGSADVLQAEQIDSTPIPLRVGKTFVIADPPSNSLIFSGPPQKLEIIEDLIKELDVRPAQVMIAAVFGQMTLTDGVDTAFSVLTQAEGRGNFSGAINNGGVLTTPTDTSPGITPIDVASGLFGGAGSISVFGEIGDFTTFFQALSSDSNFQLLARPSVFTSNNEKAVLSSGSRIAIPSGQSSNFGGNGLNTNFQFQNVELKLEVIPLVNSEDEVTLEIALISDAIGTNRPVGGGTDPLEIPDIITRQIITKVTVPNEGTIALGGLITTTENESESGVPLLRDIPYLGRLFSSNSESSERDELVIFIQPTVISSGFELSELQGDFNHRHGISEDALNLSHGRGEGMLPEVGSYNPPAETQRKTVRKKSAPQKKKFTSKKQAPKPEPQPVPVKKKDRKNFFSSGKR